MLQYIDRSINTAFFMSGLMLILIMLRRVCNTKEIIYSKKSIEEQIEEKHTALVTLEKQLDDLLKDQEKRKIERKEKIAKALADYENDPLNMHSPEYIREHYNYGSSKGYHSMEYFLRELILNAKYELAYLHLQRAEVDLEKTKLTKDIHKIKNATLFKNMTEAVTICSKIEKDQYISSYNEEMLEILNRAKEKYERCEKEYNDFAKIKDPTGYSVD